MEMAWLVVFLLLLVIGGILWLTHQQEGGLRILMYHQVDPEKSNFLTVKVCELEKQIQWLVQEGYTFLSFSDLLKKEQDNSSLSSKSVVLTFDDGYQNNADYLFPLLKKYDLKATIFLPIGFIGKTNQWDDGQDRIMDWESLASCKEHFEYGFHSYSHQNMAELTVEDFSKEMEICLAEVGRHGLSTVPVLAYPYGRFIKEANKRNVYDQVLRNLGFQYALRIGNTINRYPFKNQLLLCRLDIRGTDTIREFASKVKRGKLKIW